MDNCFELYGFDVLIDENIKPWLLEVNFSPSLGADCQADIISKKSMLHDLLDLLHFKVKDAERGGEDFRHFFKTFSGHACYRRRGSTVKKGAGHNKRSGKQGAQGGKQSRQDAQHCSTTAGSPTQRADVIFGLPLAGPLNASHDDGWGGEEGKGEEAPCIAGSGKKAVGERGGKGSCGAAPLMTVAPEAGRSKVEDVLDSVVNQALANNQMLVDSDSRSLPASHLHEAHSKAAAISADSHNSGGSEDSEASKLSADSGIASSVGKSASGSAKVTMGSVFGSLPKVLSRSRNGSVGGISRRDGWCRDEASLHLPSLENSTSSKNSKRSKKTVLTPRSTANSTMSEYADRPQRNGFEPGTLSQTRSRSVSTKSLLSLNNGRSSQRQHRPEAGNPMMTHRSAASMSVASVQSEMVTVSQRSVHQRNQSSMSYSSPSVPAKSRFMQPHPRQHKYPQPRGSTPHGGFATLRKRVGNFYLVFPFNEATHKVALTTLDPKVVIRETQRSVREALNIVSNSRSSTVHGACDGSFCKDGEGLWAPLTVTKDDA